jgi:NTE family protein
MTTRALVLGGGGPVGIGWEAGLIAGLDEQGVRLQDADFIVGTSAGSVVGALLALGRPPRDLVAAQVAVAASTRPELRPVQRAADLGPLMEHFRNALTSGKSAQEQRTELGRLALSAETISEEESLATFGRMNGLGAAAWPERKFACTAIDTADGSFVAWDARSGAPLGRAVASSCAVPGIYPPITIDGRRYMDGGVGGSTTNAHVASGYDKVLVVSVTSSFSAARAGPYATRLRQRIERELDGLRAGGAAVELIEPDETSLDAFGPSLMDGTRRKPALEAGLRQGRAEAPRVARFWDGPSL